MNNQACGIEVARDTPEVLRALQELRQTTERYEHLVGRLAGRLSCVTSPCPAVNPNETKPTGYSVALAGEIGEIQRKLVATTDELESMYERIEL